MTQGRIVVVRPSWIGERHYMEISQLDNKVAKALCGVCGFSQSFTIVNDIKHPCMCKSCMSHHKEDNSNDDV